MNALPGFTLLESGPLEPVETPPDLAPSMAGLAISARRKPDTGGGPIALAPGPRAIPIRAKTRLGIVILAVSVIAHAAALAVFAGHLPARGVAEAVIETVSAEIIFEPAPQTESDAQAAAPGEVQATNEQISFTDAELNAALPPLPDPLPVPEFDQPEEAPQVVVPAPAAELAILSVPPRIEPASAAVPEKAEPAPVRKTVSKASPAVKNPKAAKPAAKPRAKAEPAAKPETQRAKPAPKQGASGAEKAATRGAKPSASGAAKAAFGAKLLSHVQRFKRYPAQAAGKTGTARLSITIDRNGRLVSSRLSAKTGNAALDGEAAAVARRAAPYPRPPEGIGGATLTFTVALRFAK